MDKKFENWDNYKLGVIAKAFMDCDYSKCKECSCNGIFCYTNSLMEGLEARKSFLQDFEKRMLH